MKHLAAIAVLLAVSSHAFAWSHSGSLSSLRSNNESHYGGHNRFR